MIEHLSRLVIKGYLRIYSMGSNNDGSMNKIELRLYRYFVAVAEERSFSRAAQLLGVSPPTLTHQIQKLEKELNVRLLTRKTRTGVHLTETGSRFLASARDVLHHSNEAELGARRAARGEIGRIAVGFMTVPIYAGLISRFVTTFRNDHPGIDITLHPLSGIANISAILANQLDVGFARRPTRYPPGLAGFPVYRQKMMLALPASHALARSRGPIAPKALANENFVSTTLGYDFVFNRHADILAKLGGFTPKVVKRAQDLLTVLTYVSVGYGIAGVSREMVNCGVPNVVFKEIGASEVPELVFEFIYRTHEPAPACRVFIQAMRSHMLKAAASRREY